MRPSNYNSGGVSASMLLPNDITFAFNPNFIEFSNVTGAKYATISHGKYESDIAFYNGKARADISLLLQSQFDDPRSTRAKDIDIEIDFDGDPSKNYSFVVRAIYGSSSIGERLNHIGAYGFDKVQDCFIRNVRWFTNYPQKLSVFNNKTFEDFYPTKDVYNYNLNTSSVEKIAVFDHTFDNSFVKNFSITSYLNAKIILHRDPSKDGYFLRWMDNLGMYQYFLFLYNSRNIKYKQDNEVEEDIIVKDYAFGGGKRMLTHESEKSYTCAAVNLTREEAEYVSTILNSPFIDLYQGTMSGGEELWVPVILKDGEKKIDENKEMQEMEISFYVPTSRPQQI